MKDLISGCRLSYPGRSLLLNNDHVGVGLLLSGIACWLRLIAVLLWRGLTRVGCVVRGTWLVALRRLWIGHSASSLNVPSTCKISTIRWMVSARMQATRRVQPHGICVRNTSPPSRLVSQHAVYQYTPLRILENIKKHNSSNWPFFLRSSCPVSVPKLSYHIRKVPAHAPHMTRAC